MRTTMIGPNYRWRGRAQDVLVSLSEAQLAFVLPSLFAPSIISLFPIDLLYLFCVSSPSSGLARSAYAVYEGCVSLGRCIHAFLSSRVPFHPPSFPRSFFHHLRLSPPPAPKEIKPHLSSLIIVVTYKRRSPRALEKPALCGTQKPRPNRRVKTLTEENLGERWSTTATRPVFFSSN